MTQEIDKPLGAFIGRFQPFHRGHKEAIDTIIDKGYKPLIIIGSASEHSTDRNPYNSQQRIKMIQTVYPDRETYDLATVSDHDSDDEWLNNIIIALESANFFTNSKARLFYNVKPQDRSTFLIDGVLHRRKFWHECIAHKIKCESIFGDWTEGSIATYDVNATELRAAIELLQANLHPSILKQVLSI